MVGPELELVAGLEGRAAGAPYARLELLVRVDIAGHSLEEARDAVAEHALGHPGEQVVVELVRGDGSRFASVEGPKTEATPPRRGRSGWWSRFRADERRGRL